jgi:hypothetical protein
MPSAADYVDLAREILRKRLDRKQGIVLSLVQVSSGDTADLIDRRTEKGKSGRPVLVNPPAHVVMPPEVYEIEWKPKRGKPQKIQFVWILSNEKSAFPVGGILFMSTVGLPINTFYLVTFNVGALDDKRCTNVHHAEMQATRFINEQPKAWRERVGTIDIWNLSRKTGLGYSPCNPCCVDLARFLRDLRALRGLWRRASITWLTLYDRNKPCGHPTDIANLREMARAGWQLKGPGWSVGGALMRLFLPDPPTVPITAPPTDVAGKGQALALAGGTTAAAQLLQDWANTYRRAFAKGFAGAALELTRENWQGRLAGLTSLSAKSYKALPAPNASAVEWERWTPTQKAIQMADVRLPTDDFATRFRWYERMLMFALAAWIRRRITQADMDQAKAVALQQASAAGIAAAVQYVKAIGGNDWDSFIALVRLSGLSDDEIGRRLEPLGAERLPRISGSAGGAAIHGISALQGARWR